MSRKLAILAAAAAAALIPASALASGYNTGTESVAAGPVTATLSWQGGDHAPQNTRLTIMRGGAVAFDAAIPQVCGQECYRYIGDGSGFQLIDLDGDHEPEVVVTATNDGCCESATGIYGFDAATGGYTAFVHGWGDAVISIDDADHDGTGELITTDERFQNLVPGSSTAFFPPLVYRYERTGAGATLVDRTRDYPAVVRREASDLRRIIDTLDKADEYAKMYVGSYVAEEFLLGRGAAGLKVLDHQAKRGMLGNAASAKRFRKRLLRLLDRYGYR